MDDFLDRARVIVAQHRAEYRSVFYMKGGLLGNPVKAITGAFKNPVYALGSTLDNPLVNAAESFIPGIGPIVAGASNAAGEALQGKSIGESLTSGLRTGVEDFAGQEVAGAAGNAFPETASDLGVSTGGNSLTDALGATSGAGTSLDSIIGGVSGIPGSIGSGMDSAANTISGLPGSISSTISDIGGSIGSGLDSILGGSGTGAGSTFTTSTPLSSDLTVPTGAGGGGDASGSVLDPNYYNNLNQTLASGGITPGAATAGNAGTASIVPGASGAGSTAAPAAAPAPSSIDSFLSHPSLSSALGIGKANAGAVIPAAALAYEGLVGQQPPKGTHQLTSEANQLAGQGAQLQSYLQSGTLPPGAQAALTQAADSQKASIRSQYAARGMSGSSAEQQDLAKVDQNVQAQGFQMASQLLNTGIQEDQLASGIYKSLVGQSIQQDAALGSAFTNFGVALNGGVPGQPAKPTA